MKTCRDCHVQLEAIFALDRGHEDRVKSGLAYSVQPPDSSFWTAKVKNQAGSIHAWLCPTCQRVEWYAEPIAPASR